MENNMIRKRLQAFQVELEKKTLDNGFTVNETRFICERALMLIRNYHSIGLNPLKEQTAAGLQDTIEQAERYYSSYDLKNRHSPVPFTLVVQPALQAITTFLAQVR